MAALRGPRRWAYQVFGALPSPVRGAGEQVLRLRAEREVRRQRGFPGGADRRLVIGPLNTAGQAERWARAAETLSSTSARSMSLERRGTGGTSYAYPSDWHLTRAVQLRGMRAHRARVLGATHVLAESAWAVLDDPYERRVPEDLAELAEAGVQAGIVIHGSEMRDLRRHAEAVPASPFRSEWDERWQRLQATVERTRAAVERAQADGVPVFVTTPDMLDHVPGARLLPLVVDVDRFAVAGSGRPVLAGRRPVVVHAPTNPRLKGTDAVERVLARLQGEGLVEYRRLTGVPNAQMPGLLAEADVVVDQVVLGNVGALAAEAMASGRVVVAHVPVPVRSRMPGLPVVDADPDTLEEVLRRMVADPATAREVAAAGPEWVRERHDGHAAARVLDEWLSLPVA